MVQSPELGGGLACERQPPRVRPVEALAKRTDAKELEAKPDVQVVLGPVGRGVVIPLRRDRERRAVPERDERGALGAGRRVPEAGDAAAATGGHGAPIGRE